MKFFLQISLLFIALNLWGQFPAKPNPAVYCNDYANILSSDEKKEIEQKLFGFYQSGAAQVVVVIQNSLNGQTVEYYANELFRKWGIGKKGENNGVLLLIAISERRMRIEVGYGLEAQVTDAIAADIIEQMKPYFKQKQFYNGIDYATTRLINLLGGSAELNQKASTQSAIDFWLIFKIVFIFLIVLLFVSFVYHFTNTDSKSPNTVRNYSHKSYTRNYNDSSHSNYSDYRDYSDYSDYRDYSDSSFGGGDSGGGGASGSW